MKTKRSGLKKIGSVFSWIVTIFLVLVIGFVAYSFFTDKHDGLGISLGKYRLMTVLTGSMQPYMYPGDMIAIKAVPAEELVKGDVITFRAANGKDLVTHRIDEVMFDGVAFYTMGDAKQIRDNNLVEYNSVIGKVTFKIPKLGLVANFLRTPLGMVLICGLFIGYAILEAIIKERRKNSSETLIKRY